ncbi:hypothetical protein N7462_007611 [Penicillium macrosclerotiorum]|uniref:uncharacterized protein n=1 Tax=Penicillium macrosclerotiorum TaxID=303699 RepID=UPI0025474B88|nr:uncharacterized protein N7462_007611 [Penicillium macrosclerotiorum]KAJ5679367.1 hypothetical protein N7462_007611 [Penicillium macrosclerotiorum]
MTINHVFVWASAAKSQSLQAFYRTILQPLGYREMIRVKNDQLVGYGSDYPYFWLQTLPEDKEPLPTHIAFDAPTPEAVDEFYRLALQHGGRDNGGPGIRKEMSRQPYYSAFIFDLDGNNVEAVCVSK